MVFTSDQSREVAEELLQHADKPLEKRRIEFKARVTQAHLDVHDWSKYIYAFLNASTRAWRLSF